MTCFSIMIIFIYSLKISCSDDGKLLGGTIFFVIISLKLLFSLTTPSIATDNDFLSLSFKPFIFCKISFCYFINTFCNFSNLLSKNLINLKNLLTSLGTRVIFYIKSYKNELDALDDTGFVDIFIIWQYL